MSAYESKWLRRLLYLFLVVKCVYWLIDFDLLFGEHNIVYKNNVQLGFIKSWAYFLYDTESSLRAKFILTATICFSILGLFAKRYARLIAIVCWFLLTNINNAIYTTLSGGDFLVQQLLFFNTFLSSGMSIKKENLFDLDKAIHNTGVLALKIQICLVYFISGVIKILDVDWQSGDAISQIFLIKDFGFPMMYEKLYQHVGILKVLTYFILGYQLLFPLLIGWKKIKKPFIVIGVIQHLYIAFIMGLPTFGCIMIIAYSIFYFPNLSVPSLNSPSMRAG